ncbi:DUF72 domain-containing protein [Achromobacter pestifer]|uniref:DUF72 domain-containing protein n=1 Tax=Achromobacter pestifer TaxID=1353889 RepID=UPI001FE410B9|nr:DUF72 domain-containing protein [Achromobacter pestifer]
MLVGTCSWTDVSLIKSHRFYPRGFGTAEQRLRYYASQFGTVEVDSSFFAMPQRSNSMLWVERTPADFIFNIKAFRLLTGHQTPPESLPADLRALLPPLGGRKKNYYYSDVPREVQDELWRRFIDAVAPLKDAGKLGAVHFQFAPWVASTREWQAHVEQCIGRMTGYLLAVEFRNATWFGEGRAQRTLAWERELGVVHVIVDEPQGVGNYAHGVWEVTHPALSVVRLHGRNAETWAAKGLSASSQRFNYEYTDVELDGLAEQVLALIDKAFTIQVLVNVNFEDQGIRAARRLHAMVNERMPLAR